MTKLSRKYRETKLALFEAHEAFYENTNIDTANALLQAEHDVDALGGCTPHKSNEVDLNWD